MDASWRDDDQDNGGKDVTSSAQLTERKESARRAVKRPGPNAMATAASATAAARSPRCTRGALPQFIHCHTSGEVGGPGRAVDCGQVSYSAAEEHGDS